MTARAGLPGALIFAQSTRRHPVGGELKGEIMAKTSYAEKLRDPRWQKKRLEVMSANEFHCEVCGDSESTLHVHHKEYFKGREVWDYEKEQLAVLCESCHESLHDKGDLLKFVCSFASMDGPGNRDELAFFIAGYIGIPYKKVLENSDWEHCSFTSAYYDAGEKSKDVASQLLRDYWQEGKAKKEMG